MKKKDRSEEVLTLKDAFLLHLRKTKENEAGYFLARTRMLWEDLLGKQAAAQTRKLMIRNKRLYVYATNAPFRANLISMRDGLRRKLNKEFGEEFLEEIIVK